MSSKHAAAMHARDRALMSSKRAAVQGVTLIEAPALEQSILSSKYKAAEHQLHRAWTYDVDAGQLNKANRKIPSEFL